MSARSLYHGANGDAILGVIESGTIKPNLGQVFFSVSRWQSVLMHGADISRMAAFAVKLSVQIPNDVGTLLTGTAGIPDTLVVLTTHPLQAEVLELYIRKRTPDGEMAVEQINGVRPIRTYLVGATTKRHG